ncbi:MAG: hypothetical protein WAR57_10860 [Candidatus Phosphoribacter sp.]
MAAGKIVGYAVKYGVKYGPHLVVAAKTLREPATAYAKRKLAAQQARRAAHAEALTLQGGTVLQVVHAGEPVWVVYSGETALAAYPAVAPVAQLVERADLSLRVVPEPPASPRDRISAAGGQVATTARSALRRSRR